jgi:hypothetical protein
MLQIITISKNDFFAIKAMEVKKNVDSNVIYLVKNVIDKDTIKFIREKIEKWALNEEQRWISLDENCVNFHRINDEYEKSYVKTKAHTFYYNLWLKESEVIKNYFLDIFDFKRQITNFTSLDYLQNKPIDGFVSRVIVHHYPIGGAIWKNILTQLIFIIQYKLLFKRRKRVKIILVVVYLFEIKKAMKKYLLTIILELGI